MQPLLVSKNPIFGDVGSIERCCVNSDWSRAAVITSTISAEQQQQQQQQKQQQQQSSYATANNKINRAPLLSLHCVAFASSPILLSERVDAPEPAQLLNNNAITDFCWCSKDPVLYAIGDGGMTLYCYSFDQQQQQQQQHNNATAPTSGDGEFDLPVKSADMAWAAAVPSEIVEAACLSPSSYNRDDPTPITSGTAAPALANLSFGSDRRIVQLRADPARIGVWVQLRSLLVSLQLVYRPVVAVSNTTTSDASISNQSSGVGKNSTSTTTTTMKLHCIASRRVPMRSSAVPPRWCAGPTSVVTLDFDTSELIVWDISGSSAVVLAHIPVNVPRKSTDHISLHFGGDRVDTIIIFNGAAKEKVMLVKTPEGTISRRTSSGLGGEHHPYATNNNNATSGSNDTTTTTTTTIKKTTTRATATWLDLSHEERRHSLQSRSRCQRPARFDPAALAAHDPAALMLQPVSDSNKFFSWNAFKSRFDPSLRHMFAQSVCFFDSLAHASSLSASSSEAAIGGAGQEEDGDDCVTTTSQLLELHTFESSNAGMCVFALLKLSRRRRRKKTTTGGTQREEKNGDDDEAAAAAGAAYASASSASSNNAMTSASFLAVVVSAKDNSLVDEVAFPLPCVPIEHAGPFIGTTGTAAQKINSLHLCAPILSQHGVGAVAFEGVVGGTHGGASASDAAAAALISSLNSTAGADGGAAAAVNNNNNNANATSALNSLIQRFAHRAAGATRVLCRINDWDDASVRDATIALAAQSGAVALASELFGLLESEEDIASAVAACSTLHKLFALRYRELNLEDHAAREPFENLVLTAIRFAEQLVLKLFTHQQHILMRHQQQPSQIQQQQRAAVVISPTTRLNIGTVSEVRLVEQACKSDDLVLFNPTSSLNPAAGIAGGGGSAVAAATDATSLAASLLEGWCRMLDCVRASTHLMQGQQPPFAAAILTRVADLRQQQQPQQHQQQQRSQWSKSSSKQQQHRSHSEHQQQQQQGKEDARSVEIIKKALALISSGRVSAALQSIRLLPPLSQKPATLSSAVSLSAFAQARHFVDSVATHVLSCVKMPSRGSSNSSSCYSTSDFTTVVGCLSKCFPSSAARDAWLRCAVLTTDSFVVRNRLIHFMLLTQKQDAVPIGEVVDEEQAEHHAKMLQRNVDFFFSSSSSSAPQSQSHAAAAADAFICQQIQRCVALLGTDSASLGQTADFAAQRALLGKEMMSVALPRTSWSPVLFRAVEKRQRKQKREENSSGSATQQQASLFFPVPPSAVPGHVSTFPLRVLSALVQDTTPAHGKRLSLLAAIERAVFDLSSSPSSRSSAGKQQRLLFPALVKIADICSDQNGFARAALSYAVAHVDFTVARCAAMILVQRSWQPSAEFVTFLEQRQHSSPLSAFVAASSDMAVTRQILAAFVAACGLAYGRVADAAGVPRAVALGDSLSFLKSQKGQQRALFFGAQLLQLSSNNSNINSSSSIIEFAAVSAALLRLAFVLFADSSVSHETTWQQTAIALQRIGILDTNNNNNNNNKSGDNNTLASWFEDEHLLRACVPANMQEFLRVSDAVLRRSGQRRDNFSSSSSTTTLNLLLLELVQALQMPPRGRGLRPHSEAFAACCVLHHQQQSSSMSATSSSFKRATDQPQHQPAIFRAVNASRSSSSGNNNNSSAVASSSSAMVARINEVVDGFMSGDFTKLRSVYLTESCVQILGQEEEEEEEDEAEDEEEDKNTRSGDENSDDDDGASELNKNNNSERRGKGTTNTAAAVATSSAAAERIRRKQEQQQQKNKKNLPRWIVLLEQHCIIGAAREAKKIGVSIEQCLNACQEMLITPAQQHMMLAAEQQQQQQQQQQQKHRHLQERDQQQHLVAPLLSKTELAEAHTLMFLVGAGFAEYARNIHRSFQLGKEDMMQAASSSSSSPSNGVAAVAAAAAVAGSVDRASGIAPWLCTICTDTADDAAHDDDDEDRRRGPASSSSAASASLIHGNSSATDTTTSEQRSKFREDAKSHFWSRILQHAFAARISSKFLFELLGAAPSIQAAVFPDLTVRAAATDGTLWGRKICSSVNTRAFIRDMGAEQLQQQQQQQQQQQIHVGIPFARCILLALNASRTDQIATQLETFLTSTTATFTAALADSSSGSGGGLNISVIAATLLRLFSLQPFPYSVAYRVVADIAENRSHLSISGSSQHRHVSSLAQLCVVVKFLADEESHNSSLSTTVTLSSPSASISSAAPMLQEDDLVDLLSAYPAISDWLRSCVVKLCQHSQQHQQQSQQQQQQQQLPQPSNNNNTHVSFSSTPTGTLRSAAALFRQFPAVGERIYKSPHGAADAIVALDDAIQEALHDITADEASLHRDRTAVPRLESLLFVVARDLNRNAIEAHLPADFTSKVWSACDSYDTAATPSSFNPPVGTGVAPMPRDLSSSLHAAAGVSSRGAAGAGAFQQNLSSSSSNTLAGNNNNNNNGSSRSSQQRRFRNGEEVWRYFREEFVEAALFPGSPWSSNIERGFFVEQIFQDWTKSSSNNTKQQQQQIASLEQELEKKRRRGDLDERVLDPLLPPLSSSSAAAASDDEQKQKLLLSQEAEARQDTAAALFALLYSETVPTLSESTIFRKTTVDNISGLLIWLVAFAVSPTDLTPDVVLRLVAIRLVAIKSKAAAAAVLTAQQQQQQQLQQQSRSGAAAVASSSSASSSSGTALAEQRLRHIQTVVTTLRAKVSADHHLLYYILTACLCSEVPELEVEGHLLRLQRDACPNYDDVIGGEKPSMDLATLQMFDSAAQNNFFFKQWLGRMFAVPRELLAKFGGGAGAAAKAGEGKSTLSNPGLETAVTQRDTVLGQMIAPFVGTERAEEIAVMSFMSVSNASNLLRDVLSTPCASWSDTVIMAAAPVAAGGATSAPAATGAGASTTEDESRYLLGEKIRVSDAVLNALEKSMLQEQQQQQQQQSQQQQQLLNPQQQATMLNLICNGIFAAWVVPLLGYRGGDDASRILVWATRNLNVLSEAYQSAKKHFSAASEQFRAHAASLHWTHEVETLARLALVLRKRHGQSFPPLSALVLRLFDVVARMEDALTGAVDDGCFAEAKLFIAAVGWRLVDNSSSMLRRGRRQQATYADSGSDKKQQQQQQQQVSLVQKKQQPAVLPWDTTLVTKVLDEADMALNALVTRGDFSPIGRFVLAVQDAPWFLTPVLHHLLQVGEYRGAFIVPLAVAANVAAPTTRSLTGSCTRLALLHYFLAASDFAVEVCGTADMYSFFGHNAPLAEGFEFESWSMLLSLMDTQKKTSAGKAEAQQKKLEKLLDEVTVSFEQSADAFFRADLFDRAFNCVLVVRLLDAVKRSNKAAAGISGASGKTIEAALAGMSESMASTLRQQGVALPTGGGSATGGGGGGGTGAGSATPDVQRRHAALEAAKAVTDPQAFLLLGCGAEFNADEWAHAMQQFVITASTGGSGGGAGASASAGSRSGAATAAAASGLGRVMEMGRYFQTACITVGADLPARMRALMPSMQPGTQRTAWEELIAQLEKI